jgi:NitT/TauT family transport system substrate-binding protein
MAWKERNVRTLRPWLAIPMLMLAALVLACGGDDKSEAGSGGGTPIKLGYSAWPGWFPWQVAEEAGLFKQAGVNVELVWFEGYTDSINALTAGKLDANSQTLNDTLTAVAAGADERIVLVNDNSSGNDQIIADRGIQSPADLKGKRIGVEAGVVDHYLLALGLQKAGLSLKDVEVVNLETGVAAASFAAGQLDAVAVFAPFTTQALKRSGAHTLFSSKDFPGSIPDHLVVSGSLVKNRNQDVQRLVNAWFLTLDYIKANPEKARAIMAKRAGVAEGEYAEYDAGTTLFSHQQNVSAFEPGNDITHLDFAAKQISQFLLDNGFVKQPIVTTDLFESRFVREYATVKP